MITSYQFSAGAVRKSSSLSIPQDTVWIDLFNPTNEERSLVESALKLKLPTHDEMHEIEISSRLYLDEGASYMIADVVTRADSAHPETHAVTFVFTRSQLVTVRFSEAAPFALFEAQVMTRPELLSTSEIALLSLMEAVIGQVGQLLRMHTTELDSISKIIFWDPMAKEDRLIAKTVGMKSALYGIGLVGETSAKLQQSLLSINRLLVFYQEYCKAKPSSSVVVRLQTMRSDVHSLSENASFLSQKIGFLMDATMGLINAEQNQIIKIFSVAAVIFLPPTLIASIYGMNFLRMPELAWPYGYPFAIILMALAAILPYTYFKSRRWI